MPNRSRSSRFRIWSPLRCSNTACEIAAALRGIFEQFGCGYWPVQRVELIALDSSLDAMSLKTQTS